MLHRHQQMAFATHLVTGIINRTNHVQVAHVIGGHLAFRIGSGITWDKHTVCIDSTSIFEVVVFLGRLIKRFQRPGGRHITQPDIVFGAGLAIGTGSITYRPIGRFRLGNRRAVAADSGNRLAGHNINRATLSYTASAAGA